MLKRFLLIIAIFLFLVPVAQAQDALRISELEVDLWPEYDHPSVLVIYHLKLSDDVTLPANISLRIPAAAGEPHAVAVRQMDGSLFNAVYERQVEGEWAIITVTATMPDIQIEYYDPQLEKDGNARQYTYVWPGDYAVDAMRIVVQQPVGATQLSVTPDLGSFTQIEGDSMQYYAMEVGSPKAGENVSVGLTYAKDTDDLSIESLQVQPSAPINGNTGEPSKLLDFLPWIIGGLGALLLAGGGVWYWLLNRAETKSAPAKRSRRTKAAIKSPEQVAAENDTLGVYCHQCGKRAAAGDRFCRTCGTKLRAG